MCANLKHTSYSKYVRNLNEGQSLDKPNTRAIMNTALFVFSEIFSRDYVQPGGSPLHVIKNEFADGIRFFILGFIMHRPEFKNETFELQKRLYNETSQSEIWNVALHNGSKTVLPT